MRDDLVVLLCIHKRRGGHCACVYAEVRVCLLNKFPFPAV